MAQTIRQLWNGQLAPARYSGADNPEIKDVLERIEQCIRTLAAALDENSENLLEEYRSLVNEYVALCSEQAFCDGYALGTRITAEALTSKQPERYTP